MDDYKALVCFFMFGGIDGHDTVIPYDEATYAAYAAPNIRGTLIGRYRDNNDFSRERENLLPLSGTDYALPANMPNLQSLFNSGKASVIANVGTLINPLTADELRNPAVPRPANLFSHNDQQSTWMAGEPEGARKGWGGAFSDVFYDADVLETNTFRSISARGQQVFLSGDRVAPFFLSPRGVLTYRRIENLRSRLPRTDDMLAAVLPHLSGGFDGVMALERDYAKTMGQSIDAGDRYRAALAELPPSSVVFPETDIAGQLQAVTEAISARDGLMSNRQVFFVGMGGFDTHSNQFGQLPPLQTEADEAIAAFVARVEEMGLSDQVTLFTASDFGRSLSSGGGTDHGWGNHHFVVGGAVDGGIMHGTVPPPEFNHPHDAGRGRLIPTISVERYAAALGQWFGLTDDQITNALPGLGSDAPLPLMRA